MQRTKYMAVYVMVSDVLCLTATIQVYIDCAYGGHHFLLKSDVHRSRCLHAIKIGIP
jgi:hypothetical protein